VDIHGGPITAVAAGDRSGMALAANGTVLAWGYDFEGELGDGSAPLAHNDPNPTPGLVQLPAGVNPVGIAAGAIAAFAITSTGQIYAWGSNTANALGAGGSAVGGGTPAQVLLGSNLVATAVIGGVQHGGAMAIVRRSPVVTAPS
jgi:alpha-tubulin suppressor-like RCC1 family protein